MKIKNIGVGIATDIEVKYSTKEDSTVVNTQIETIELLYSPDKSDAVKRSELSLHINGLQPITPTTTQEQGYYSQHNVKLKVNLEYKDLLGKKHSSKKELDVSAAAREFRFQH